MGWTEFSNRLGGQYRGGIHSELGDLADVID